MDRKVKIGYWMYGLSFVLPNYDFQFAGIHLAVDCAIGGATRVFALLSNPFYSVQALFSFSLLFQNYLILPGVDVAKRWRIASMVWVWTPVFLPYSRSSESVYLLIAVPPYLLWAASITLLNYAKLQNVQSQSPDSIRADGDS